jgi:hypothetical protein
MTVEFFGVSGTRLPAQCYDPTLRDVADVPWQMRDLTFYLLAQPDAVAHDNSSSAANSSSSVW